MKNKREKRGAKIHHNKKLFWIIILLTILLIGTIILREKRSPDDKIERECNSDEECVPSTCCHPDSCVPAREAPVCEGIVCSAVCSGPLDCGAGRCRCIKGKCEVIPNERK